MKISTKLYIAATIILVGMVQQSFAMNMWTYPLACKQLGARQGATDQEILKAFEAKKAKFENDATALELLTGAKKYLDYVSGKRTRAQEFKVYKTKRISCVRTGWFTQQVGIEEHNVSHCFNTMYIDTYDYKRIYGAIGLGLSAAGIASYFFRNEVASLFNARLMPLLTSAISKVPFLAQRS